MKEKSLNRINDLLDASIESIKKSKFAKAKPDAQDTEKLIEVVSELCATKSPDKEEKRLAKKIIKVANAFYQFADLEENVLVMRLIPDIHYNALALKYSEEGNDGAYVPKDLEKKTADYQELTSNLMKAYRMTDKDEIPDGVKEKGSIESFLDAIWKENDLKKDDEVELEMTPKIDGVSINSSVKKDKVKETLSRGSVDSKSGEEQSVIINGLNGLMDKYAELAEESIGIDKYGIAHELFVTKQQKEELEKLFGRDDARFVSCRNTASSALKRLFKDKDGLAKEIIKNLSFYPTMMSNNVDLKFKEKRALMLENWANIPSDMIAPIYIKGTKKELLKQIEEETATIFENRFKLSYDIDGIVLTVVKNSYQDTLGRDGRKNKYQLAYKFEPNFAIGTVIGASGDVGAFGKITDKLTLENPVIIQGTAYPFAHLLKAEDFELLDLHAGDEIMIIRTGDAIPAVAVEKSKALKKYPGNRKIERAKNCPYCGGKIESKGKIRICAASYCGAKVQGKILNMLEVLGIVGLDVGFAKKMAAADKTTIRDLYELTDTDLFNMGIKSGAKRFIKEIQEAIENMEPYELIDALGIDQLRAARAKKILRVISIKDLIQTPYHDLIDQVKSVDGIDSFATQFISGINEHKNVIEHMLKVMKNEDNETDVNRIQICFSGFRPTKKEEKKLRVLGYDVSTSKKNFAILATDKTEGEKYEAYLKNAETRKLMTSKEFYSWLEEQEI